MLYFDTAYIAKCYLNEPGAAAVRKVAYSSKGLISSELARAEFYLVLHRHLREGHLSPAEAKDIRDDFEQDVIGGVWQWIPLTSHLIDLVCHHVVSAPSDLFIRTADLTHIVCASSHGLREIYSNDRHLLSAAAHFNLTGINII